LSNKEIAARLVITPGTVKQHTHHIYQRLNVKTRWQAVTSAEALGILPSNTE
jgi:ATP/maltotriose-dependent transcriptional regulator MalT